MRQHLSLFEPSYLEIHLPATYVLPNFTNHLPALLSIYPPRSFTRILDACFHVLKDLPPAQARMHASTLQKIFTPRTKITQIEFSFATSHQKIK